MIPATQEPTAAERLWPYTTLRRSRAERPDLTWLPLRGLIAGTRDLSPLTDPIRLSAKPTGPQLTPRFAASYVMRALTGPPVASMLASGEVPLLEPGDLWLGVDELGWVPALVSERRVAMRRGYHSELASCLDALLTPIVGMLRRDLGVAPRISWYAAVDGVGDVLTTLGDPPAASREMDRFLAAAAGTELRAHRSGFLPSPGPPGEPEGVCWLRNACCRADQGQDGELCATCPKLTPAESLARLAAG